MDTIGGTVATRHFCSQNRAVLAGVQVPPAAFPGVVSRHLGSALGANQGPLGIPADVDDNLTLFQVEGDLSDHPGVLNAEDLSI